MVANSSLVVERGWHVGGICLSNEKQIWKGRVFCYYCVHASSVQQLIQLLALLDCCLPPLLLFISLSTELQFLTTKVGRRIFRVLFSEARKDRTGAAVEQYFWNCFSSVIGKIKIFPLMTGKQVFWVHLNSLWKIKAWLFCRVSTLGTVEVLMAYDITCGSTSMFS